MHRRFVGRLGAGVAVVLGMLIHRKSNLADSSIEGSSRRPQRPQRAAALRLGCASRARAVERTAWGIAVESVVAACRRSFGWWASKVVAMPAEIRRCFEVAATPAQTSAQFEGGGHAGAPLGAWREPGMARRARACGRGDSGRDFRTGIITGRSWVVYLLR